MTLSRPRRSDAVLERLLALHPKKIDLALDRILRLLAALGNPQLKLPPVIHVAGTNGKGSACAFSRAMLEAQGLRVHVHTSPHLVRFHERIRIAGKLISRRGAGRRCWKRCERVNARRARSPFSRSPPRPCSWPFRAIPPMRVVLEVGLGGTYDATNVVPHPAMTVIQPVGLDHQEFLGNDLAGIAAEKAGIIKKGVAAGGGAAGARSPREVILRRADRLGAPAVRVRPGFRQPARNMAAWSMRTRTGCSICRCPDWSAATRSRMPASPSPPCAMPAQAGARTPRSSRACPPWNGRRGCSA